MDKIILAIDEVENADEAVDLVRQIGSEFYAVKIHSLYDKFGPEIVRALKLAGAKKVWVDFKLLDIPNTARLRTAFLDADIVSVHAAGGVEMMKQAVLSGKEIFAITVLTSLSPAEVKQIYNREVDDVVLELAKLAKEAKVAGIVCSPKEVKMLRSREELSGLKIVVPGVRSAGKESNDQERVGTPEQALLDGADYLVVGRQITKAENPKEEAKKLCEEIRKYAMLKT
ncbi:MAG: Orotidine 5'-phosphate decarboxylase [Candidatus Nomurabacteria bacterium GW2011_GWA1_46_11]|uniref:Orotidine 5'-phosphate decarboxylase n=1 Tax=Candidatus Nomurabacteria bacterium GW2011_GWA1_46_11 TaxID=1618732 RepID=A0A0G1NN46_9BACT|nr:MAG: Orotidine 5'-phosphate decarboxylase [Candidatus Nomurabacteria bacterium GW2011_GWA1_46_11]